MEEDLLEVEKNPEEFCWDQCGYGSDSIVKKAGSDINITKTLDGIVKLSIIHEQHNTASNDGVQENEAETNNDRTATFTTSRVESDQSEEENIHENLMITA